MERVVITGLGVVSPLGIGKSLYIDAVAEGTPGLRRRSHVDPSSGLDVTELTNFDFAAHSQFGEDKRAKYLDRYAQYATVAVEEALADAGLSGVGVARAGIILGSAYGCIDTNARYYESLLQKGPRFVNPVVYQNTVPNTPGGTCAMLFGMEGVNTMISAGATSGLNAIAYGANSIQMGRARAIVAGGVEKGCALLYQSLRAGTERTEPSDFPIAEGAAVFVLESLTHAQQRGAAIYAEICGSGFASGHGKRAVGGVRADGRVVAMQQASAEAGINLSQINLLYEKPDAGDGALFSSSVKQVDIREINGDILGCEGPFALLDALCSCTPTKPCSGTQEAMAPNLGTFTLINTIDADGGVVSLILHHPCGFILEQKITVLHAR